MSPAAADAPRTPISTQFVIFNLFGDYILPLWLTYDFQPFPRKDPNLPRAAARALDRPRGAPDL